ncbi:lutropin-choriogonadotropic hormone receptor-like [Schistocerca cancellata]|uniref:lutropin-choriogonadotropic hormone receptor-like n=1 Tax=Schistocerca cancellata TaxID=274614 RepID=UPI0021198C6D|nr:lutropin-choriogonadotropic hormone receptor-like [Schistocerca cancellata]
MAVEPLEPTDQLSDRNGAKILCLITLSNVRHLRTIEEGVFEGLLNLRTIYIYQAPALLTIPATVFRVELPNLKILRIVHTGLQAAPLLDDLQTSDIMHMVDLDNNKIERIGRRWIKLKAEQMLLNYNALEAVEAEAFWGSHIATLSLKGNRALSHLDMDAFVGLNHLRRIDLSETAVTQLPTRGLEGIDELRLQDTSSLKVFPSVYNFENIRVALLTYPYHCCAFQFPGTHDPAAHHRHEIFMQEMKQRCSDEGLEAVSVPATPSDRERRWAGNWSSSAGTDDSLGGGGGGGGVATTVTGSLGRPSHLAAFPRTTTNDADGSAMDSVTREVRGACRMRMRSVPAASDENDAERTAAVTVSPVRAECGRLSQNYRQVECRPRPDAFSPCEDLMGGWALRGAVWLVALAALAGNLAVLLVLGCARRSVPGFLMAQLAAADLCMGLYLLLLAAQDARSVGRYFTTAVAWQTGAGCQAAGVLTVFASELSVFTLTVITCERWYTITYAIHLNRRLKLRTAAKIMAAGWCYAVCMAVLPLLGVSSYSKTSLCLPLESRTAVDSAYLLSLLTFSVLAFCAVSACYARMYCVVRGDGQGAVARSDATVAKRMALLVFTDFACWAPIAFFGLTALAGQPLIDVPRTKVLLVCFYPLNACANPVLYALLSRQYRRDLLLLLSRHGLCAQRAARYKGAAAPTLTSDGPGKGLYVQHHRHNQHYPNHLRLELRSPPNRRSASVDQQAGESASSYL